MRAGAAAPGAPEEGAGSGVTGGSTADPVAAAKAVVLRRLTAAPRSRAQLAEDLAGRGFEEDVIAEVLDRFVEVGLIDDAEYARMVVRSQGESRRLGRRGLAQELRRRGVPEAEASQALADLDPEVEEARARDLVRRRWDPDGDQRAQARRLAGMLGRRGFPHDMITRVLTDVLRGRDADTWDA